MKKQTACLVSLIFAAVLLLGTGCAPQQPKEITLIFKMPTLATASITNPDIKEAYDIFKEAAADFSSQYKAAQVSINLVKFDLADETAYITDCFDSPDAPDLLYEDFFNMSTYIYTGRVIPLDSIISAEWRADVDSSYWQMSQVQGKTYMLPYLARQNVMGYHRSMLRNAGLGRYVNDSEDIGTWSLSDWNTILGTLAAKLPENCYGEAMYAQNEQSDTHIMTMLRSHGSGFFSEDGHFNLNTAEGIAALSWIKSNADKGCYPPHSEQLAARDCGKLFWNNQLAVKMINGPGKDSDDKDIGLVNFPSLRQGIRDGIRYRL